VPGCAWCSCPVTGRVTLLEMSCRSGLQAAIRAEFIGARMRLPQKNRNYPAHRQGRKPPGAGCRGPEADRATRPTHHPELEPSSASTDDHNDLDRAGPAPITIEAGMHSPPASQGAHDERTERSPANAAIKHLTPSPINPQRSPLLPLRSAFAYFSGACEK